MSLHTDSGFNQPVGLYSLVHVDLISITNIVIQLLNSLLN